MKTSPSLGLFVLASGLWLSVSALPAAVLPAPVLEYLFNETGTTASSTGTTAATATLTNANNGTVVSGVDLHGAPGSGVSGLSSDRAFNNTGANNMGPYAGNSSYAHGGSATTASGLGIGLQSFTIAGWFKTDGAALGGSARLLDGNGSGFYLAGSANGMTLVVGNSSATSGSATYAGTASTNAYRAVSEWVFFAVSYDGSITANNVNFYVGSLAGEVSLVTTQTLDKGSFTLGSLNLGNNSSDIRPFDGLLDNIRIYGSATDAAGALNQALLEQVRLADTAAIPEPSTCALATGLLVLTLAGARKGRLAVRWFRR